MTNVKQMFATKQNEGTTVASGGEPPYDDGMETRVAKLEQFVVDARERLTKIETRLDETATKSDIAEIRVDMHKGFADMTKWVVGTAIGMGAAGIVVMTFVLNNAVPKTPSTPAAPTPIIIYAQPAPVAAPVAPTTPPAAPTTN